MRDNTAPRVIIPRRTTAYCTSRWNGGVNAERSAVAAGTTEVSTKFAPLRPWPQFVELIVNEVGSGFDGG